jgi:hypothetical protein
MPLGNNVRNVCKNAVREEGIVQAIYRREPWQHGGTDNGEIEGVIKIRSEWTVRLLTWTPHFGDISLIALVGQFNRRNAKMGEVPPKRARYQHDCGKRKKFIK